jgi:hypothetical protein
MHHFFEHHSSFRASRRGSSNSRTVVHYIKKKHVLIKGFGENRPVVRQEFTPPM